MASQAAAKAVGGVVSIAKVRTTYPFLLPCGVNWRQFTLSNGLRLRSKADVETRRNKPSSPPVSGRLSARLSPSIPTAPTVSPLNPYFRNPTPGALDPLSFDDPVTLPAGDIADNAYWKRDVRRAYPQLSVVTQGDAVSLLTVGSAAQPKVELIGEAGEKALVAAQKEGETGLAKFLEKAPKDVAKDVFVDGLPPVPSGTTLTAGGWDVHKYELNEEQTYGEGYPTRTFK
ncbi:hypothetical protein TrVGV298_002773 [Trichoderma virens]|nr:hypothetical protein TrVGV298_002773 [Trichoderma virens]